MNSLRRAVTWSKDSDGIAILTLDDPDSPVNTMNAAYREAMGDVVRELVGEKDRIAGVIVTSAKKTFFAGGDLKALAAVGPADAARLLEETASIARQLRTLETMGVPVVAALGGTALGGGLELALACHRRIAIDSPGARFGCPEVTLGLLPGANGVVRTVRLLGVLDALTKVLLHGQEMDCRQAVAAGLIDELVPDGATLMAAARASIAGRRISQQPWDAEGYRMPGGTPSTAPLAAQLPGLVANLKKRLRGADLLAPRLIVAAAVEGAQVDFDNAARIEARYFVELATGRVAKNILKTLFFDLRRFNGAGARPKDTPPWKPRKVGVLGAGMMGAGIALVTAKAGMPCVLKDVTLARAEEGRRHGVKALDGAVAAGRLTRAQAEDILGLIRPTSDLADLEGCEMIVEAVFEDRELKHRVTQEAASRVDRDAIVCSNTSTLPITGLARGLEKPEKFIGMHFFSPVDRMPLVEIIVGKQTSAETVARAIDFVLQLKKTPIVVKDSRGFFTSRVFNTFVMEGVTMLAEGWAPASIEQAALQNGSPIGPLAVCDEVSIELSRNVRVQAQKDFAAEGREYRLGPADALVDRMCLEFGRRGRAAGSGFYEYPDGKRRQLWQGLATHFVRTERRSPSSEEFADLRDRLLYVTSLESLRCLDEGVVRSAADANVASILGIGAPAWTGGTIQFVNYVGVRRFVERAGELARRYGERFSPPRIVLEAAERGMDVS